MLKRRPNAAQRKKTPPIETEVPGSVWKVSPFTLSPGELEARILLVDHEDLTVAANNLAPGFFFSDRSDLRTFIGRSFRYAQTSCG
ncbi:hypothetical protein WU85_05615 [Corynebacterium striatum]|nr:hypothetical protein WU85_05615 [Corynebacterium striatum]